MDDIRKDEFFGEVKYKPNIGSWVGITDAPLYNSEGNLKLVVQDLEKEGILDVQREAYKTYLQKKDAYFMQLTEVLSAANAESTQTVQPKTLYIDREGNMGWICYTNWDDSHLGVLFTGENILLVTDYQLKNMGEYGLVDDKVCGKLITDGVFAGRAEIISFLGKIQTFYLDFQLEDGKLTKEQRNAYKKYLNKNPKFWENIKDVMLDYYLGIYEDMAEFIEVPEGLEIENVTRDNVLNIVDFGRIYFTYDGRGCFLGECPIGEEEGIGFEFTDGEIEIIEPSEIL